MVSVRRGALWLSHGPAQLAMRPSAHRLARAPEVRSRSCHLRPRLDASCMPHAGAWTGTAFSCALLAPTFPAANFSIPEGSAAGVVVGKLNASTVSSLLVTFAIASGNTNGAFALDACSGALTVAVPSALVFATTPVFSLLVNALTNNDASATTVGVITVMLSKVPKPPLLLTTAVSILVNSTVGMAASPAIVAYDDSGAATSFALSSSSGTTFTVQQTGNNTAALVLATAGAVVLLARGMLRAKLWSPNETHAGALNFWTTPVMVVSLILTSVSNSSLTTVATLTVSVLYAPTAPTVPPGQVRRSLSANEELSSLISPSPPLGSNRVRDVRCHRVAVIPRVDAVSLCKEHQCRPRHANLHAARGVRRCAYRRNGAAPRRGCEPRRRKCHHGFHRPQGPPRRYGRLPNAGSRYLHHAGRLHGHGPRDGQHRPLDDGQRIHARPRRQLCDEQRCSEPGIAHGRPRHARWNHADTHGWLVFGPLGPDAQGDVRGESLKEAAAVSEPRVFSPPLSRLCPLHQPYTSSNCTVFPGVGDPQSPSYVPAYITCLNPPGSGANWPLSLYVGGVKIQHASVLFVSYAPPQVAGVSPTLPGDLFPPPTTVVPTALSTQGGEQFYLSGQHLGQVRRLPARVAPASLAKFNYPTPPPQAFELGNISVSYGPPSNPSVFAALVLGAGDSWLLIASSAGFGVSLSITVTVSGQSAISTSTGLAYGVSGLQSLLSAL